MEPIHSDGFHFLFFGGFKPTGVLCVLADARAAVHWVAVCRWWRCKASGKQKETQSNRPKRTQGEVQQWFWLGEAVCATIVAIFAVVQNTAPPKKSTRCAGKRHALTLLAKSIIMKQNGGKNAATSSEKRRQNRCMKRC